MSKFLMIAGAAVAMLTTVAAGTTQAEARGLGGGLRGGNIGGFRPAASSFRPIGNIPNIGNRIGNIGGIGNRIGGLPGNLRPVLPPGLKLPPGLRPLPPRGPGSPPGLKPPPPHHGGGKGGAVAIGVAIGSGLALAASSECSYPYRKWQETGSRAWKDRYYSCMGY